MVAKCRYDTEKFLFVFIFDHEERFRELVQLFFHVEGDKGEDVELQKAGLPCEAAGLITLGPEPFKNEHGERAQFLKLFMPEELRLYGSDASHFFFYPLPLIATE